MLLVKTIFTTETLHKLKYFLKIIPYLYFPYQLMKRELRNENDCLNCSATVAGRYCSQCGQENRDPRESFGELPYHFFSDFTHFDSKFFTTIKDLVLYPGFLTKEYIAGKRMHYLNPIRMYIFISLKLILSGYCLFIWCWPLGMFIRDLLSAHSLKQSGSASCIASPF